jgi:ABC-type polysaccharide/polyol phosphate transport system ATPase subunit
MKRIKQKTIIRFEEVTKEYYLQEYKTFKELIPSLVKGDNWAKKKVVFSDLNFTITKGESVGIVGRNGTGKSTILKLIAGVTYPSSGNITVAAKVAPLIELSAGFHHELSGYENIYLNAAILGLHKDETDSIVNEVIDFSGLHEYIHVPIKRYSTGMQMRLAFAVVIQINAPILLIDEVLAVGDAEFQAKCLKKLNELKATNEQTSIFISHDQRAVESFCERVLVLDQGSVVFDGKPSAAFTFYNRLLRY